MAIRFKQNAGIGSSLGAKMPSSGARALSSGARTACSGAKTSSTGAKTLVLLILLASGFLVLSFPAQFAHAANRPMRGRDGDCTWAYQETALGSGEFTLSITRDQGGNGTLSNWEDGRPQWFMAGHDVYANTKRIEVGVGVKAQTCYQMFGSIFTRECFERVESIDASHLDTSAVKNMLGVFARCTNLESVDISGWSASAEVVMAGMFEECLSLTQLKVGHRFMFASDSGFDIATGFRCGTGWAKAQTQATSGGSDATGISKEHLFDDFRALVTSHNSFYDAQSNGAPKIYRKVSRIMYRLDGGTNSPSNPDAYMTNVGIASFGAASKAGHAFLGWYSRDGKTKVTRILPHKVGDYVLYARFMPVGWQRSKEDGTVFYRYETGEKAVGWQRLKGTIDQPESPQEYWFCFDADGAALRGEQELRRGADKSPKQFFFDRKTGVQLCGWHQVKKDGIERRYYYGKEDGAMLKGLHFLKDSNNQNGNWFYFDEETGIQVRGWKYISHENKLCYFGEDGAALRGWYKVFGKTRHFDEKTGFLM